MLFVVSLALLACTAYAGSSQSLIGTLTPQSSQSVILNGGVASSGSLIGGAVLPSAGYAGEYVSGGAALPAGAFATEYVSGGAVLPAGAVSGGYLAGGALSGGYLAGGALSGGAVVSGPVVAGGVQNVYAEHAHVVPGQEIVYKVRSAPKVQKHVALAAQVIRQPKYIVSQPRYNVLRQVVPSPAVEDVTVVQEPKPHVVDVVPQVHKETVVVDTPAPKPQVFLSQRRRKSYAKKVDVDQHKITHHSGSGDVTVEDVKRLLDSGKFDGPNTPQKVTYSVNGVPQATHYNAPVAPVAPVAEVAVAPTTYINTAPAGEIALSGAVAPAAEVISTGPAVYSTGASAAIAPAGEVISTGPAVYSAGAPAAAVYTADAPAATVYSSGAPAGAVYTSGAPATTIYSSGAPAAAIYSSGAPSAAIYSSGAPAVEVTYGQGSNGALSALASGNGQGSTSISFQSANGGASTGSAKPFLFGSSSTVSRVGTKH